MLERYFRMDLKTAGVVIASFGIVGSLLAIISFNTIFFITNANRNPKADHDITPLLVLLVVGMMIITINLCASMALLYGIKKAISKFLFPWLVLMATNTWLCAFELFVTMALFPTGISVEIFLITAFCLCTWLAIYTLYHEMRAEPPVQTIEP